MIVTGRPPGHPGAGFIASAFPLRPKVCHQRTFTLCRTTLTDQTLAAVVDSVMMA